MVKRILVAYFSRNGENYFKGDIQYIEVGNTKVIVDKIADKINVDIFKIEMKNPYSKEYNICVEEAKKHKQENARPDLVSMLDSIDNYDKIILAYPNYWNTMPMAVFTFLDAFNFEGKEIYPICTHEGSGMGVSEKDIEKICFKSSIKKGLSLIGSNVLSSDNQIDAWLKINNLK